LLGCLVRISPQDGLGATRPHVGSGRLTQHFAQIGAAAIPALRDGLSARDEDRALACVLGLVKIGEQGLSVL
jgi:hypothetical protein